LRAFDKGLRKATGDPGAEYGGIRVKLVAMLGNARIPMQVDVVFGNAIISQPKVLTMCDCGLADDR
jgi:hypothetical protein